MNEEKGFNNMQELPLEFENAYREIFPRACHIADIIRLQPYDQMEKYLDCIAADAPSLKEDVKNILIKYSGMGDDSMDTLYNEGYNLENVLNDVRYVINCYKEIKQQK